MSENYPENRGHCKKWGLTPLIDPINPINLPQ